MVVLVTGAARGYGEVVSRSLAAAGARVGVLGRDGSAVERLAGSIDGVPLVADVTDETQLDIAVSDLVRSCGGIDVLVNNAGVGGTLGPAWEVTSDDWWSCFEVNVRGSYLASRSVIPHMIEVGSGRVVNVVSNAGTARWPLGSSYAVSKAAIIKLGENLAAEVRRYGIAVVNYHPGIMEIGLTETLLASRPAESTSEGRVAAWFRQEIADGHSVRVEDSAAKLVEIVSGRLDSLSGRYVTAYDDFDRIAATVAGGGPNLFTLGLITE